MLTSTPSPARPVVVDTAAPVRGFARWATTPTAATVPLVRSRVRRLLEGWQVTGDIADVLLLAVSELVGNVVLHTAATGRMRVGITLRGGWLQLEVSDGAASLPRLPHPRAEADQDAEDGRGLLLVQLLTAETGGELTVTAREFGKSVRVRVPAA